ncbi:YgaP family membrane protein [Yoonia sp.]|uniref:YgaP family membrane protein n=1 Tax=Yoonia sp. TaxID=2212373 RepID=UPI003F6BA038
MTANMGKADRLLRLIAGLVLIAAPLIGGMGLFGMTWLNYVMIVAGIVMLATSTMRFCPLYTIFGIRTCKV